MKYLFIWPTVVITLIASVVSGVVVNGDIWGTLYLKALVPGVTIPDLTPLYAAQDLPGFFRAMGENGRLAYVTINNLDLLFSASYAFFGVSVFGIILRYLMSNKAKASRLALLGAIPGLLDILESACFRIIVMNPYSDHLIIASMAAIATPLKFMTINVALFSLLLLLSRVLIVRQKHLKDAPQEV